MCRPSDLLTFLLSYFSKYSCSSVFIRGFPYPFSSFLFTISGLNVLVAGTGNSNLKELSLLLPPIKFKNLLYNSGG